MIAPPMPSSRPIRQPAIEMITASAGTGSGCRAGERRWPRGMPISRVRSVTETSMMSWRCRCRRPAVKPSAGRRAAATSRVAFRRIGNRGQVADREIVVLPFRSRWRWRSSAIIARSTIGIASGLAALTMAIRTEPWNGEPNTLTLRRCQWNDQHVVLVAAVEVLAPSVPGGRRSRTGYVIRSVLPTGLSSPTEIARRGLCRSSHARRRADIGVGKEGAVGTFHERTSKYARRWCRERRRSSCWRRAPVVPNRVDRCHAEHTVEFAGALASATVSVGAPLPERTPPGCTLAGQ